MLQVISDSSVSNTQMCGDLPVTAVFPKILFSCGWRPRAASSAASAVARSLPRIMAMLMSSPSGCTRDFGTQQGDSTVMRGERDKRKSDRKAMSNGYWMGERADRLLSGSHTLKTLTLASQAAHYWFQDGDPAVHAVCPTHNNVWSPFLCTTELRCCSRPGLGNRPTSASRQLYPS